MDYRAKYLEYVSQVVGKKDGDAFEAGVLAERARILALLRDAVDRRRRVAEVFGGPYSRYFALIELELMLND